MVQKEVSSYEGLQGKPGYIAPPGGLSSHDHKNEGRPSLNDKVKSFKDYNADKPRCPHPIELEKIRDH
jgi:hypothetical protein